MACSSYASDSFLLTGKSVRLVDSDVHVERNMVQCLGTTYTRDMETKQGLCRLDATGGGGHVQTSSQL